jgi:hypothetical protein
MQFFLVLVRKEENRLRHMPDLMLRQEWLILRHEVHRILCGDIMIVDYRESGRIEIEADRFDSASRDGRANRPPVKHVREDEVVSVSGRPCGLPDSILARHARSNCIHFVKMVTVPLSGKHLSAE